jgi:hypothetical protein
VRRILLTLFSLGQLNVMEMNLSITEKLLKGVKLIGF